MMKDLLNLERNDVDAAVAFFRQWAPLPPDVGQMLITLFDDPNRLFEAIKAIKQGE